MGMNIESATMTLVGPPPADHHEGQANEVKVESHPGGGVTVYVSCESGDGGAGYMIDVAPALCAYIAGFFTACGRVRR